MAYTKTTWADRIVQFANRYTKSGETSSEVTLVQSPGTVTEAGTTVNAANLNKIEKGIGQAHWYGVTTNTTNNFSVVLDPVPASFAELTGVPIRVKCNANASGAVTLNVNALGAKAVKSSFGVAIATWKLNSIYTLVYNGTDFILQGEGGSGNATPAQVLAGSTYSNDSGPQTGTMPIRNVHQSGLSVVGSAGRVQIQVPDGWWTGSTNVWYDDSDYIASSILLGKDLFGLAGTAYRSAEGTSPATYNSGTNNMELIISGLSFAPKLFAYILTGYAAEADAGNYGLYMASGFFGPNPWSVNRSTAFGLTYTTSVDYVATASGITAKRLVTGNTALTLYWKVFG